MNNAIFKYAMPANEAVRSYVPGSRDRKKLQAELENLTNSETEIPLIIGGKEVKTGDTGKVVMPHDHNNILATYHKAGEREVQQAIDSALKANRDWGLVSWAERVSVTLKIAELISGKYRHLLNAATMLGQSKSVYQAEIDAACETIDFLRFNAHYISDIYDDQPLQERGIVNRLEYRPLEGFVFSITPFNFTAIAANLNLAPVLMGNAVVWKPASTALLSNYILMKIFKEAGIPDGVINFIPGKGSMIGNLVMAHKDLAGIHFTGSTSTFNQIWQTAAKNLDDYKSYPKLVGETGGKDFIVVHNSADLQQVATAFVRGAFEYQGQKCSAASRAYVPESNWHKIKESMIDMLKDIKVGSPSDFSNFMNAVIDEAAFNSIVEYIEYAKSSDKAEIVYGGGADKGKGYFIEPTVILTTDPHFKTMEEEIFGPVLTIFVYKDDQYDEMINLVDSTSPYALTGSVFANDRNILYETCRALRYSAGNFYYNDKPTGAVVGQQPFGGSRMSGTNDKAGSHMNLMRWTSPRTIKENLVPPEDFKYPFMKDECH